MSRRIVKYILGVGLIIAITMFIFNNSFDNYESSHNASDAISEIILPDKYANSENVSLIIRKTAHLIEYSVLGISVMLLVKLIESDFGKKYYTTALFYVLLVAVLDEHIQSFSDRTSSTGDILLDFFGSLIGFTIVITIHFVYVKLKNIKERGTLIEMVLETEQKEKRG